MRAVHRNVPRSALLTVVPVAKWYSVFPGVVTTDLSWIILGNLTMQRLFCQLTTDHGSNSEVSSLTFGLAGVLTAGLFSTFFFTPCLCLYQPSCDAFRGSCKVQLKDLSPSCRYSARVRCSVTGRLWGPWTQALSFKTCESP